MQNRAEHPDRATAEAGLPGEQIGSAQANNQPCIAEPEGFGPPDDETHRPAGGEPKRARISSAAEIWDSEMQAAEAVASAQPEIERIRAHAAAQIAATREQTNRALAQLDRARIEIEDHRRDGATSLASSQLLTLPIPPTAIGARTGRIEEALYTVRRLGYMLELSAADEPERQDLDGELGRSLLNTMREHAENLSDELHNLCARHPSPPHAETAAGYARAAAHAYCALLQRIADASQQLEFRGHNTDDAVVEMVTQTLANHPWRRH